MSRIGLVGCAIWWCSTCEVASTTVRAPGDPFSPAIVWHVAGEGRGTPAIVDDTVYFLSKRHEVVAIDTASGRVRWKANTGEPGEATAGSVVTASSSLVIAGDYNVVAFDRQGRFRWRFAPPDGYGPGVHLGNAAGPLVFAGSPSGRVFAIDVDTGVARWTVRAGGTDTTVFAPIADDDLVFAGFTTFSAPTRGGVVAIDRETGVERWRVSLPFVHDSGAALTGGPAVIGDIVSVTNRDGTILVMDRRSGRLLRTIASVGERAVPNTPIVAEDFRAIAFSGRTLVAGSLTGTVVAYDVDTGSERWRRRPVEASVGFAIAADTRRVVYVPYLSGELVALDVDTGAERWSTAPAPGFTWMPRVYHDRVYAAASRAGFFALGR